MSDVLDRLDSFRMRGDLSDAESKLLADWAKSGPACEAALGGFLSRAGRARDTTARRRALGAALARAGNLKCFL